MRTSLFSAHVGMLLLGAASAVPGIVPRAESDAATAKAYELEATAPTKAPPADADQLMDNLSSIWRPNNGRSYYDNLREQIRANILPSGGVPLVGSSKLYNPGGVSSYDNQNTVEPAAAVYPHMGQDPAFSVPEARLRAAIYIPPAFTWGQKPPVIFVQCTGGWAHEIFENNMLKLTTDTDFADPVWINIPGALLEDAQISAEYVAYAVNYIAGVTGGRSSTVISWSQGGLVVQWALTFWPSIRASVRHFLPISPDFRGSVLANTMCVVVPVLRWFFVPCDAAVIQQSATSNFVKALGRHGGLDAWVPTTSFYSATLDSIVQPQSGKGASAYILDGHGAGALNVEPQSICKGKPGGGWYDHATMLSHPLTVALTMAALHNDGPPSLDRIDLDDVCSKKIGDGLTTDDANKSAGQSISAGVRVLAYPWKTLLEPWLKPYCR